MDLKLLKYAKMLLKNYTYQKFKISLQYCVDHSMAMLAVTALCINITDTMHSPG